MSSLVARRVLVTRAAGQADELLSALRVVGLEPVPVATIAIEFDLDREGVHDAIGRLPTYAWIVITSPNGARAILRGAHDISTELGGPSWAAIGPTTRDVLARAGIAVRFQPSRSSGRAMAAELPVQSGERVLVVRGDRADGRLALALRARGAAVDDVVGYRTREAPEESRALLQRAFAAGPIDAVVLTSGSTARGLLELEGSAGDSIDVRAIPCVCIGPETATEARAAGFRILAVAPAPDSASLAAATARFLASQQREIP